ncbi:tRNA uridine-5-carboxymethylaminomethyl(34) synthesis GTPase MnmE [Buchnera aphidicola (Hyadaphis tataricae)]|uniref:tRNA modification GTPase MnmE n=1 Tax=Buchnera aphidicola (Hyadaphis tataricae) TaxID=1241859 RepID=A0A4D6XUA0_9GAMM|nr:tRNA uridine-5-carboxymethylaminomethyl(34) synthesis GTPase MnmE [Buchnera aphidicola]QCI21352.1 tRNA uridine-5-carboxymethylaminomethyl(34) synthesis GTPase MnmE [Buchnera aphidicola (Hyadaphis tataricae)]
MINNDTIVAQVTHPGKSSVGILRISGPKTKTIAIEILGALPRARYATYSNFLDSQKRVLDKGIALWFPAPCSFTGEDILELQGHGSPLIIDLLIQRITSIMHTRIARPGEFSERAFLNGKIDLIQAEAIDDLINAETELSIRASLNSLQGDFSSSIEKLINVIVALRMHVESTIDFSEEDINIDINQIINSQLKQLDHHFKKLKKTIAEGKLLKEGKKIVIVGFPNTGKSSLLNILSCSDRAIVTNIAGTTRDLLYQYVNINGIVCELIDTAGLRNTHNEIERIGIKRAWNILQTANHILFVIDATIEPLEQKKISKDFLNKIPTNIEVTFVLNKNDLLNKRFGVKKIKDMFFFRVSALTGEGIDSLRNHIVNIEKNKSEEGVFIARRRHINQINLAYNELSRAQKNWSSYENIELLAESLNLMNKFLGEITGKFSTEDLLKNIFSNFCIGK